jgi:hypothetical protein
MAFLLRTIVFPPLNQIVAVPQIVIIDQTGPAVVLGTQQGACCLVGEFVAGSFAPTEVDSSGDVQGIYTADGTIYKYFSQSAAGIQDGTQVTYEGNGLLALLSKTFQRLVLVRVDHEAVTTDGGTTRGVLDVTVTVAASDQDGSSNTAKDIVIPAGTRFGSNNTFAGSTRVFAASGNTTIPKGTTLSANAVTVQVTCFPVRVVEPVVATAISAISFVLDPVLQNVAATTTITAVNNATILWPSGTGTTLATRLESRYAPAIAATLPVASPGDAISVIWAARRTSVIRVAVVQNAVDSSAVGRGRIGLVAADPAAGTTAGNKVAAVTAAIGLAAADNYVQPADRAIICFPQSKVLVPDFGNIKVTVNSDGWMATTLANFPEEVNPGAANAFIQAIIEPEDCFVVNPLTKQDYINLIAAGVCALYRDRAAGWQWMQGVTAASSTLYPTRTPIKRRRMADLIQDTIAQIAAPYLKQPATTERIDSFTSEVTSFLDSLLSPDQPSAQRIVAYQVDETSGNTAKLLSQGIFILIVNVTTLASMDDIVIESRIGETVQITSPVAAAA